MSRHNRHSRVPGMTARPARALYLLPSINDDDDPETKNAIAIRNAATASGECPACGAVGELQQLDRNVWHLVFRHEDNCRALTNRSQP